MLSPASQHRLKINEEGQHQKVTANSGDDVQRHDAVLRGVFQVDFSRAKTIKSHLRRKDFKRHALKRYQVWLDSFVKYLHKTGFDSELEEMFVWLMLWHIDVGDWRRGLQLAHVALTANMSVMKGFERNIAEVICEEIVGGILKSGASVEYADLLEELAELLADEDMLDQISAKLCKARGLSCIDSTPKQAIQFFEQALRLDENVGVKRYLKVLHSKPKPKSCKAYNNVQEYSLSATAAAKMANITTPTLIRRAKKYPDRLPHIAIPFGSRTFYRFSPKHVRAYMRKYLVKN